MNLLNLLQVLLPVLGTAVHANPEIATLVQQLIVIGEAEIKRRMAENNQTREQVLRDAADTWAEAVRGADDLARLGHETG